ncbi:hypothetical protein Ciccas_010327 [Cichlidogyrus casuarinus]|uniref:Ribosomal protein L32 n=1 Tax=Cichlidogyrus casuarinus TaxID=1844966 RepID=A0ABD2PWE4_9PLAT
MNSDKKEMQFNPRLSKFAKSSPEKKTCTESGHGFSKRTALLRQATIGAQCGFQKRIKFPFIKGSRRSSSFESASFSSGKSILATSVDHA